MAMDAYKPYLDWIDLQYPRMITLLEKWSLVNSGSHHLAGLERMRHLLMAEFACLGGSVQEHKLTDRKFINVQGNEESVPSGFAISIIKRPELQHRLLLCGHYDTVYAETDPFQNLEHCAGDILKGPGVADMKGGLVIMLIALEAFERSPWSAQVGWEVVLNPDEEIGSMASAPLLQRAAKHATVGLVFEPALDGCLVHERKGSVNFTLVVRGKSAHAGRDIHLGRNAIHALSHFIHDLENEISTQKEVTINVGMIKGGTAVNVVPDFAMCRFNIRGNDRGITAVRERITSLLAAWSATTGTVCSLHEDSCRGEKPYLGKVVALFDRFKNCADELGIHFQLRSSGGVCDGNILAAAGLPTVDSLGPVGGHIHSSEEYIYLPSLIERAKWTALFLMKGGYL